jgi:hypothetical protein
VTEEKVGGVEDFCLSAVLAYTFIAANPAGCYTQGKKNKLVYLYSDVLEYSN